MVEMRGWSQLLFRARQSLILLKLGSEDHGCLLIHNCNQLYKTTGQPPVYKQLVGSKGLERCGIYGSWSCTKHLSLFLARLADKDTLSLLYRSSSRQVMKFKNKRYCTCCKLKMIGLTIPWQREKDEGGSNFATLFVPCWQHSRTRMEVP